MAAASKEIQSSGCICRRHTPQQAQQVIERAARHSLRRIAYHRNGPISSPQNIHRRVSAYGDVPMEYGSIPVSTRSSRAR